MDSGMETSDSRAFLDTCADLFSLVLCLRESDDLANPDAVYNRIVDILAPLEIEEKPRDLKEYAIYALVGFIDETIGWRSRLELRFFGTNVAGDDFFKYLERIKETQSRDGVLEVYYLCLVLGFEGRYAARPERLQGYIEDIRRELDTRIVEKLSPDGARPKESLQRRRSRIPRWLPWVVALAGVGVVILLLILLRIRISRLATSVVSRILGFLR